MVSNTEAALIENPQPCHLWRLPQEIQDTIFALAYPKQRDINICFRRDWERREEYEQNKDRSGYTVRPFPSHKVNEFMVSKRFFVGATKAWFSAQAWTYEYLSREGSQVSTFIATDNGLFLHFAQEIQTTFSRSTTRSIRNMVQLRKLHLLVRESDFEGINGKDAWEDIFKEDELNQLPIVAMFDEVRGLKVFDMKPNYCTFANTERKEKILKANVKALVAIIRPKVTLAKPAPVLATGKEVTSCLPIYRSSHVCFACSGIHRPHGELMSFEEAFEALENEEAARNSSRLWKRGITDEDISNTREGVREMMRTQSERVIDYLIRANQNSMGMRLEELTQAM